MARLTLGLAALLAAGPVLTTPARAEIVVKSDAGFVSGAQLSGVFLPCKSLPA